MIINYKKENIDGCKYKFRLGELFRHTKIDVVDVSMDKLPELVPIELPYIIKPGEFVIGRTIEEFDTPLDLMSIYAASSLSIRIGLNILCGGINDPGYKGKAILGIQNISPNKIKLFSGMNLMHTAFINLNGKAIPIQTKYIGGKIL
jgi:deoxycytidine triphosphate deaminase